eukprot:CAMPEP_0181135836 /NCGR_PEP_ID=MMETSP1071-20121207/32866_1 /TAXON_ID=35127 /ORGANISM="Thalassiosira sp., Strain NH16" /LENGTH=521 /DNA_ID=CAMNT_0023222513 /DNA_START=40 /DNA_END=1605 /DNA_ORIENTATION=-
MPKSTQSPPPPPSSLSNGIKKKWHRRPQDGNNSDDPSLRRPRSRLEGSDGSMIAIGNNSVDDASRQRQRSELIERRTGGYSIDIGDRSKARQPSGSNYGGFPNIAAIVLLIAIADVLFVGYSIDASLGGGDGNNEPHRHLGAEAGLHRFHEKTRLKQLQDEHDIMKHNRTVNSIESTGVGSTLLRPNKEVVEGENRARLITSNSNGDIIESVKTPLVQKDQQYRGIDERISKILISANAEVDEETLSKLPTWDDVISQYGEKPIIYGLETCEAYRQSVKPEDRMIGPAGIFNTGTNLLFQLMKENCDIRDAFLSKTHREPKRNGIRWQAPWGKHNTPSTHRLKHVATFWGEGINHTAFFPVVMIKDPYGWMGSQCRHPYQAHWDHKVGNCPNLIHDRNRTEEVFVKYALGWTAYDSLIDLWNKFYEEYEQQTFPYLATRYEDLLFHGEEVAKIACDCVGGEFTRRGEKFKYIEGSAKDNGMPINNGAYGLVKSLLQYGDPRNRLILRIVIDGMLSGIQGID